MLFKYTYPNNHTLENLNSYLVEFINKLDTTNEQSQFVLGDYFHKDFVEVLTISPVLEKKFEVFFNSFKVLDPEIKTEFIDLLEQSQNIANFYADLNEDCSNMKTEYIQNLIGDNSFTLLADQLFKSLKLDRWEIKNHYELIYNALQYKICPFCGVEILHKTFREDYDHLAPKTHYPLISANPRNLAPMCHTCNCKNKGAKDILYNDNGDRKEFVYPYDSSIDIVFDYSNSTIPQTDMAHPIGDWIIQFDPDNSETQNWDSIFNIKKRYIEDFITPNFETWLDDFILDCIESNITLDTDQTIKDQLGFFARSFKRKWYEQSNIIKGPLFEFLESSNNSSFYISIIKRYNKLIQQNAA